MALKSISIDLLSESTTNPRKSFGDLAELGKSIKVSGVIQPIIVRPSKQDDGKFEIIAGARRFRAAKEVGLETVPAVVVLATDDVALTMQVIENLQRADVHPLDEAAGYKVLIDKLDPEQHQTDSARIERVAAELGKGIPYIARRLKLLDLSPTAVKLFEGARLTVTHAELLARFPAATQDLALKELKNYSGQTGKDEPIVTLGQLRRWLGDNTVHPLDKAPFNILDATLYPEAGACGPCPKNAKNNQGLFADLAKGAVCLDGICYSHKIDLSVRKVIKDHEAKGERVYRMSTKYYQRGKGLLGAGEVRDGLKGTCPDIGIGVIVETDEREKGQLGEIVKGVCPNPKCKVHKQERESDSIGSRGSMSEADKAAARKKQFAKRLDLTTRLRVWDALKGVLPEKLTGADLKLFAGKIWELGDYRSHQRYSAIAELEPDKSKWGAKDYASPTRAAIERMSEPELVRFLLIFAFATEIQPTWENTKPTGLYELSDRYKIPRAKITERLSYELLSKKAKAELEKKGKTPAWAKVAAKTEKPKAKAAKAKG